MYGGDSGLELEPADVSARQNPFQDGDTLEDQATVPQPAVLLGERDQVAALVAAGGVPGLCQQHQGEGARDLVVVGQLLLQLSSEADRLPGQGGVEQHLSGGAGVALVEDQVEHVQEGGYPLRQRVLARQPEARSRGSEGAAGPGQPLRHSAFGHEEGGRDLGCCQSGDGSKGERDLSWTGQ